MRKTPVEIAKQQVIDGQQRIARQQELVRTLEASGQKHMLAQSLKLLSEMIDCQHLTELHLQEMKHLSRRG